jgi:uncharacterized delta-60 repeat protein
MNRSVQHRWSLDTNFISDTFQPDIGYAVTNDIDFNKAYSLAVQSDGKVLVGGLFFHFECDDEGCTDFPRAFLNRLHADGSRDTSFSAPELFATSILPLADGKVLIGGGIAANRIYSVARLNADGSFDDSCILFAPEDHASSVSIAVAPEGKILVGRGRSIIRLNADGSLDSSFNVGTGVNDSISAVAVQPDGKVIIGGAFTEFNGTNRKSIARLNSDGSLDTSFHSGSGPDGGISHIVLQPNGDVLISGYFTTVNGVVRPRVARLHGDSVSIPLLNIARSDGFLNLSWPASASGFTLQETTNLSLANSWSAISQTATTNGAQISVTFPASADRKFFRLKSQ